MGEIFIRYMKMDIAAIAFTATDENGDYNIYVNTSYGYSRQQEAIRHEMRHINMNHFYAVSDVLQDEKAAENKSPATPQEDTGHIAATAATPLEELRLTCGLSAHKVATLRDIPRCSYFLYEKGLSKCPPQTEHKIISVLLNYKNGNINE